MKPTVNFRCEPWEKELLERLAERSRRTLSDQIKFLVEKALGRTLEEIAREEGILELQRRKTWQDRRKA